MRTKWKRNEIVRICILLLHVVALFSSISTICQAETWGTSIPGSICVKRKVVLASAGGGLGQLLSLPKLNTQQRQKLQKAKTEVGARTRAISKHMRKRIERVDWTKPLSSSGVYYGMTPETVKQSTTDRQKTKRPSKVKDQMSETLDEIKRMRKEMEAMRKELHDIKQRFGGSESVDPAEKQQSGVATLIDRRKRQREFDRLAKDIEKWAEELVFDQVDAIDQKDSSIDSKNQCGWTEIECNKMFRHMNPDGRTRAFLKWMKDSRGEKYADPNDNREYPCLKVHSTIDAPLEEVCLYLSQPEHIEDYNELISDYRDLEEISPYSKICWGLTPQILFIKPRAMVTFCHHRWLRDGTQVVVNQACEHESYGEEGKTPRAYALRGANWIGRHPTDPEKTQVTLLAHANPGHDVPQWAMKTAIKSLVPIEPFKLFYKINVAVNSCREELAQKVRSLDQAEMVSTPSGMTRRPAGLAQLGYACFWPHGGGLEEGSSQSDSSDTQQDEDEPLAPSS